jgi:hypothetical protein
MFEELKSGGTAQLGEVVNEVALLYELDPDPAEQIV